MKFRKSSGAVSTTILILAGILIVLIVIIFFVIKTTTTQKSATGKTGTSATVVNEPPKPVYDATIGDIRFVVESASDMGSVMAGNNKFYNQTLTTTEKFIKVIIGAQNKGKVDTLQGAWVLGNIIDSDGRNFISINSRAYTFLPNPNLCGTILKPEFALVPCVGFYEVSRQSAGLKIEVHTVGQSGIGGSQKGQETFLDLNVQ